MDPSMQCLVLIYIGYWSLVDFLQQNVESTLELDFEGTNIRMSPNGPYFELIYLVGIGYEGQIDSRFIFVRKGVLIIMQGCIGLSEQGLWIGIID